MNSRAKGRGAENEVAKRYGGKRISATGLSGSDVRIGMFEYEVKRVASLSAQLRAWLEQAERQGATGVIFREDHGKWYIVLEADRILKPQPITVLPLPSSEV